MTVVAAALEHGRVAIAADGVTVSFAGRIVMRDNVKVVPLFGRFAVAWAGEEGLLDDERLGRRDANGRFPDSFALERPRGERDPFRRAGRVRIEEIMRACETTSDQRPATCRDVVAAVYAAFAWRYAATVASTPDRAEGRYVKFFVAGWDENERLGRVLGVTCTVVRPGPRRYRVRCAVRPLWSSDQPAADVQLFALRTPGHLRTDIELPPADAPRRAIALVRDACEDYERSVLREQRGGIIHCVEVTPRGAHALAPVSS